jgi:glycosyltransferase involved in cell wall biosynthesis
MRGRPGVVSTEHNVWGSHSTATRVANALTLPLDDVRWAVSEQVRSSEWKPWRTKTEVLVHGVPLSSLRTRGRERDAARTAQGWGEDDVVVATVANLRANKDYPTLFAAAADAMAAEPRLRFVSIGQGPLEAELRAALASAGLGGRFVMVGYHEDPPALLAGADLFTLTSRHEGLPIALLEAMAVGLPPVVTSVGGNAEVITQGVDGVLVPAGSTRRLADAYVDLARDRTARARLAAAAARRAEDFDIARTAQIAEARYRLLAAR